MVGSVLTRVRVDANGNPSLPDIMGGVENQGCPIVGNMGKGDRCTLGLTGITSDPHPYTYSDFTGFGLRNFSTPRGFYARLIASQCPQETRWIRAEWTGDVPPKTSLTARFRAGPTMVPDMSWTAWSSPSAAPPLELTSIEPKDGVLQLEFDLATTDQKVTPKLQEFRVIYECITIE